jgi:hypothetical protein
MFYKRNSEGGRGFGGFGFWLWLWAMRMFAFGFYFGLLPLALAWVFLLWALTFGFLVWEALEGKGITDGKKTGKGKLLRVKEWLKMS